MQTPSPQNPAHLARLPISAIMAALTALLALGLTMHDWLLPVPLAFALLATLPFDNRFDASSRGVWITRLALYAWVLFWCWNRFNSPDGDSFEIMLAYAAAMGAGCELVLQAWLKQPLGGARGAVTVLLSGAIIMGASATFDTSYVRLLVPQYMLFLAFSLRAFRGTGNAGGINKKRSGLAWVAIALAITGGMGSHLMVAAYRFEIAQLGARFFRENVQAEPVGLSTNPRLGASFGESGSTTRVLRMENWPASQQYLRVMSFSTYGNGAWTPNLENRQFTEVTPVELHANARGERVRIDRLIDDQGLIVAPLHSAGIDTPPGASLEWTPESGGPLRSKDPAPFPFVYEVALPTQENFQGPLCTPPSAQEQERCLQIPPEIPMEVRLLAQTIGGNFSDPMQRVLAVQEYLMSSNEYSSKTRPGAGDPTASFILEKKAAHCEYFASAAAMLLRSLKVPTRYVIGYYVHEGEGNGVATVRLRDGHAWCESWIPGTGWVTVDATPGGARPDKINEPIPFWQKWRERTQDFIMLLRNSLAQLGGGTSYALIGLGVTVLLGLGIYRFRNDRKNRDPQFQYSAPAELQPVAKRFEKLLRRRGIPCPPQRTWRDHLDNLACDAELAGAIDIAAALSFIRQYNRARFARPAPADMARLHEQLHHLEKSERTSKK